MAEATAMGNVCLRFLSTEVISDDVWTLFQKWLGRNLAESTFSNHRVPGVHHEAQICYAQTFNTKQEFLDSVREKVERMRTAGRIPRLIHAAHAEYWLGSSIDSSPVYWHTTIDLDRERGRHVPPQAALD